MINLGKVLEESVLEKVKNAEADLQKLGLDHDWGSSYDKWDKQCSSNTLVKDDEARHRQRSHGSGVWKTGLLVSYTTGALVLVVINFILQLPPAVLGQFNSKPKPLYLFILMLLSHASLLLWIIELVYRWKRETVTQRMWRGKQPLLYFPSSTNSKPFFSLADIVGLLSTIFQSILTTVNYGLLVQHTNTQIQISGWPIILAFVRLCSTFWGDRTQKDQPDHVPLHSIIIDTPTSEYQESSTSLQDHFKATGWKYVLCSKITIEQVFAIVNFILELPSAVLDQLCSEPKPLYALVLMLLSFASILLCIIELLHKGKMERVTWSWKQNGKVPWLYPNKPFFSFWDKVGLICAVVQPILSTVNYALVLQRSSQIQISVLPIVFSLALSCSKIWESPNMTQSEGNIDEEEQVVLINQRHGVTEVSPEKESEPTASEEGKSGLTNQSQITVNEEVFPKPEKSVVEDDNKIVRETEDGWVQLYEDQTHYEREDGRVQLYEDRTHYERKKRTLEDLIERERLIRRALEDMIKRERLIRRALEDPTRRLRKFSLCFELLIVLKEIEETYEAALKTSSFGILKTLKTEKTRAIESKHCVWRKEKEYMREPTRRRTDNVHRRRVKSRR